MPDIKTTPGNAVPECATPGRMMAYLKSRNPELNPRFDSVATEYMRYGEQFGVRWDYAIYQMIIETGSLSYRRDVKPTQNNFAGLGATGGGEPGESFKDIASGVRAHLEHLLLYAGDRIESPIAERTRKVQDWGVLAKWRAGFKRPINFSDLAAQWAPGSRGYGKMLEAIAERFDDFCGQPDPRPHLVQEARAYKAQAETKTAEAPLERPSGADLARRAVDEGKAREHDQRSALGAQEIAATKGSSISFKLLNAGAPEQELSQQPGASAPAQPSAGTIEPSAKAKDAALKTKAPTNPSTAPKAQTSQPPFQTASAAGAAKPLVPQAPPAAAQRCRVWTASYGGQKALIIKSTIDKMVNYTVLDVNEGAEKREADAFISAYAKEGVIAGEFGSQAQALDKAFELCPEG